MHRRCVDLGAVRLGEMHDETIAGRFKYERTPAGGRGGVLCPDRCDGADFFTIAEYVVSDGTVGAGPP